MIDDEIIEYTDLSEIEQENIEEETTTITTTIETTTTTTTSTTTTLIFDKKINDIQSESEFFGVFAFMLFVIFICTVFFNKGR